MSLCSYLCGSQGHYITNTIIANTLAFVCSNICSTVSDCDSTMNVRNNTVNRENEKLNNVGNNTSNRENEKLSDVLMFEISNMKSLYEKMSREGEVMTWYFENGKRVLLQKRHKTLEMLDHFKNTSILLLTISLSIQTVLIISRFVR